MASHDSNSSSSSLSSAALSDFASFAEAFSFIPMKLDSNNYLYWKALVLAIVRAFDLLLFINKIDLSPKYIQLEDNESIVNPDFLNWMWSDQLLLGWLVLTIDKEVIDQVMHCESAAEVWTTLNNLFSRQTVACLFQLKSNLGPLRKVI